jgi:hypothetical protein
VVVESTGGATGDSFFIVLVTILEDEEEDDGSHDGDLNPFDFGGFDDFESETDLDLVFLVNLMDWPVFFSYPVVKKEKRK